MKIKPIYEKSILVKFRRGDNVQSTEIVEANWEQVHTLIANTFVDRVKKPISEKNVPVTRIWMMELDHIKHQVKKIPFKYKDNKKEFEKPYVLVFNISPREARIQFEKAINNNQ